MLHDLTRSEVVPALLGWSYFIGCSEPLRVSLPDSLGWLRARWDAGDEHLPLTLVHDLGNLLLRGRDFRFASARDLSRWPPSERTFRLGYEDRVLGRWALDPSVQDAHVAIAGMSVAHRDAAVSHAVGLALSRPLRAMAQHAGEEHSLVQGNSAHLRALGDSVLARLPADFDGWTAVLNEPWIAWAREQLEACVRGLPGTRLLAVEDLWEIAHLPELPSESARIALREVNAVAAAVGAVSPAVAQGIRHAAREVPVEAEEADQYPAGGFDAVSTRGVFENMVRSEVTYVGEGAVEPGGVDLFDVRFAENELLYYTRDDSPLLDARRDVTLVFDRPAEQRSKLPAMPTQTLVLAQGVGLAVQADLLRVFGHAGSRTAIVWRCATTEDRTVAAEERALLALPLAAEIAHRRVELRVVDTWSEVPVTARVVFSPRPPDREIVAVAWVRVGDETWRLEDETWEARGGVGTLRPLVDRVLTAVTRREHRVGPRVGPRARRP